MIRIATTFAAVTAFQRRRARGTLALCAVIATGLASCATTPVESSGERLDSKTGTTVTLMPKPVELIVDRTGGPKTDPFAYLAPFETNRMGSHELWLWVSAPQVAAPLAQPQVFCGEQLLPLEPFTGALTDIGLSSPPYAAPAPWSMQWYFRLSGEVLDCLAQARQLKIMTRAGDAEPDRFIAEAAALSGVAGFAARVRT